MVFPGAPLDGYRLVVVPALFLIDDDGAETLRRYVAAGGRLVVSYLTGVCDRYTRIRPNPLSALLGVRVEEFLPLDKPVRLSTGDARLDGTLWSERIHLEGAVPEMMYCEGPLANLPAVTRHGAVWYVSTRLDAERYTRKLAEVINAER